MQVHQMRLEAAGIARARPVLGWRAGAWQSRTAGPTGPGRRAGWRQRQRQHNTAVSLTPAPAARERRAAARRAGRRRSPEAGDLVVDRHLPRAPAGRRLRVLLRGLRRGRFRARPEARPAVRARARPWAMSSRPARGAAPGATACRAARGAEETMRRRRHRAPPRPAGPAAAAAGRAKAACCSATSCGAAQRPRNAGVTSARCCRAAPARLPPARRRHRPSAACSAAPRRRAPAPPCRRRPCSWLFCIQRPVIRRPQGAAEIRPPKESAPGPAARHELAAARWAAARGAGAGRQHVVSAGQLRELRCRPLSPLSPKQPQCASCVQPTAGARSAGPGLFAGELGVLPGMGWRRGAPGALRCLPVTARVAARRTAPKACSKGPGRAAAPAPVGRGPSVTSRPPPSASAPPLGSCRAPGRVRQAMGAPRAGGARLTPRCASGAGCDVCRVCWIAATWCGVSFPASLGAIREHWRRREVATAAAPYQPGCAAAVSGMAATQSTVRTTQRCCGLGSGPAAAGGRWPPRLSSSPPRGW
jgi:hypothetical protein